MLITVFGVLLASPRGEVASRSDDGEGTVSVAIKYRSSQQQFSRAIGHNANFVWKTRTKLR